MTYSERVIHADERVSILNKGKGAGVGVWVGPMEVLKDDGDVEDSRQLHPEVLYATRQDGLFSRSFIRCHETVDSGKKKKSSSAVLRAISKKWQTST